MKRLEALALPIAIFGFGSMCFTGAWKPFGRINLLAGAVWLLAAAYCGAIQEIRFNMAVGHWPWSMRRRFLFGSLFLWAVVLAGLSGGCALLVAALLDGGPLGK